GFRQNNTSFAISAGGNSAWRKGALHYALGNQAGVARSGPLARLVARRHSASRTVRHRDSPPARSTDYGVPRRGNGTNEGEPVVTGRDAQDSPNTTGVRFTVGIPLDGRNAVALQTSTLESQAGVCQV